MNKIINLNKAVKISNKMKKEGKKTVLAGGVFDILHIGHITFLTKAKSLGDYLFILLESDEFARKTKGKKRPINSQSERAVVLSALSAVDFIIKLKGILKDKDYDRIVERLSPKVIATSAQDQNLEQKKRQADKIGAKVTEAVKRLPHKSTSKILEYLK